MEEEKRVIKEPQHKQLIMDIGKTKIHRKLTFQARYRGNIQG